VIYCRRLWLFGGPPADQCCRIALLLVVANVIRPSFLGTTSLQVSRRVRPHYLEMKNAIQQTTEDVLVASLDCQVEEVTARVVPLCEATTDVLVKVYCQGQSPRSTSAASAPASRIRGRTGHGSKVRVKVIPYWSFSTFQPGDCLPDHTHW